MSLYNDYPLEETIHILFTSRQFSTGAPFTLAGTPALSVYEDESLTQITAGVSLGVDHDTVTGLNLATIVATAANGYEAGKSYHVVVTTGTVDSVSVVGEVVGAFTINRGAALRPTTAGRTLDVSAGGEAGIDWANIGTPGSTVDLSATTTSVVDTATAVTTVNGVATDAIDAAALAADAGTEIGTAVWASAARTLTAATNITSTGGTTVPQTGDSFARLGAPAGASVSADIAALNDISVADILTTQMTESYAAAGTAPTLAQALFYIHQILGDFAISGTTLTVRNLAGTAAGTHTLDDGTSPTALDRTT